VGQLQRDLKADDRDSSRQAKTAREVQRQPASGCEVDSAAGTDAGFRLPEDYAKFLQGVDGGEGFVGNTYLILWRAEELLAMNRAYQVAEYAPGLFLFGSDRGGEAFGFDTRSDTKPIVSVPFAGMKLKVARPSTTPKARC
jgi:hypothetical protein